MLLSPGGGHQALPTPLPLFPKFLTPTDIRRRQFSLQDGALSRYLVVGGWFICAASASPARCSVVGRFCILCPWQVVHDVDGDVRPIRFSLPPAASGGFWPLLLN